MFVFNSISSLPFFLSCMLYSFFLCLKMVAFNNFFMLPFLLSCMFFISIKTNLSVNKYKTMKLTVFNSGLKPYMIKCFPNCQRSSLPRRDQPNQTNPLNRPKPRKRGHIFSLRVIITLAAPVVNYRFTYARIATAKRSTTSTLPKGTFFNLLITRYSLNIVCIIPIRSENLQIVNLTVIKGLPRYYVNPYRMYPKTVASKLRFVFLFGSFLLK